VRQVEVTAGGTRISGNVFGSRPRPYSQTIMLASNGRAITIKGYCSCPLGVNCKHVAAVLLQHLELQLQGTDNASLVTATAPESFDPLFDPFSCATSKSPEHALPVRPIEPRAALSRQVTQWLDRLACATAMHTPLQEM
jgi:SWIM zinc finger